MSNEGMFVRVHYTGTFDDGTVFDSSRDHGEPMEFQCMAGTMIPGFDYAVRDMEVGDIIDIHLEPIDAYGEYDEDLIQLVPTEYFPNLSGIPIGKPIFLQDDSGFFPATILAVEEDGVRVDLNPPMAGKALNFNIELLDVNDGPFVGKDAR